ncbi:unannotated protein [freshwater metagenome]|uniref:Unannotated protein n=1 Tax=freshwater metagenome TaxID=449393 RepID=A0A6J6SHM2_9ZZZZ
MRMAVYAWASRSVSRSGRVACSGRSRSAGRASVRLEMVGAYERPLSFSTMMTRRLEWPRLLSASYAMPPVIEPSPITATMCRRGSCPASRATARPYA